MERLTDYIRRPSQSDARVFGKAAAIIGLAKLENVVNAQEFAQQKCRDRDWSDVGDAVAAAVRTKSAIGGVESDSSYTPALSTIAQGIVGESVLGRVPNARRLRFVEQVGLGSIIGTGASWRKSGRAIRVAPVEFAGVSLRPLSVAGIAVASKEMLEKAVVDDSAAETIAQVLRDAVRRELDSVFCGANAAVADERPAGLAYSATTVAATGATAATISADVRSMVAAMASGGVSLRSAFWILSAEAHSLLATLKVLDQNGTTLAGRPVVSDAPSGTFLLVAGDFLSYARDDQVGISVSTSGTIEMDSAPSGSTPTPTAMANSTISLFQSDAVAVKAVLTVDWAVSGPEDGSPSGRYAAIALTGTTYA
jgi:hypothetical protein